MQRIGRALDEADDAVVAAPCVEAPEASPTRTMVLGVLAEIRERRGGT